MNHLRTTRRRVLAGAGAAGLLALGKAPAFAQTAPKKLVWAHNVAPPESGAIAFAEMAKAVTKESKGELEINFQGGTLLTKELEIMNAVKAGNIAIGDPGGAACLAAQSETAEQLGIDEDVLIEQHRGCTEMPPANTTAASQNTNSD